MINIKDKNAFIKMRKTGELLARMFSSLQNVIQQGITTEQIDGFIADYLNQHNLVSCTKGYMGYKHVSCISVNEVVVHGIPNNTYVNSGDLVKVDVCASFNGYCADMARGFFIGDAQEDAVKLMNIAQKSLDAGINKAQIGNRLTDISFAIQQVVEGAGFGVVRDFAGHGIGKKMHEAPEILNYGSPGRGPVIRQGMAFAIEPMITMGDYHVVIERDGWTVKTRDKSLAAHVEDTVIITENGPEIITRL